MIGFDYLKYSCAWSIQYSRPYFSYIPKFPAAIENETSTNWSSMTAKII
jgi:hypothetical protein